MKEKQEGGKATRSMQTSFTVGRSAISKARDFGSHAWGQTIWLQTPVLVFALHTYCRVTQALVCAATLSPNIEGQNRVVSIV